MSPLPAETIRRYLDDHGGETDATLGHLLTGFGVEDEDPATRDRIATVLNQAGIYTDRPISFLQPDDGLHLSTSPPPPAGEPGPTAEDEFERISVQERRAGWYQDPMSRDHLRWWDGSAWTDVARPVAAPAPYIAPPPPPPPGPPSASWYKRWWVSGLV